VGPSAFGLGAARFIQFGHIIAVLWVTMLLLGLLLIRLKRSLSLLKRLVAHAAGVLLRSQQAVELLLGQPVARDSVLPVGLLAGLR
jgi:hypothetical protein